MHKCVPCDVTFTLTSALSSRKIDNQIEREEFEVHIYKNVRITKYYRHTKGLHFKIACVANNANNSR